MRYLLFTFIAILFATVAIADDDKPAATQPATAAKKAATTVDRDAVLKELRDKEEKEEQEDEEGTAGEPEDPDEPAKPSGAIIKPVSPERLKAGRTFRANTNTQIIKWLDVDGDGKTELIVPSWQRSILIFKDLSGEPEEINLEGLGNGTLCDVIPIPQAKGVRWFVATRESSLGSVFGAGSSLVALYDEKGDQLWKYAIKAPKNTTVEMHVAVGDVDGDGVSEYVAGVAVQKARAAGNNSWTIENQTAYLMVFNAQGKPLCSRKAGESVQNVQVIESPKKGEPGRILMMSYNGISTYTLKPAAATQPAEK